MSNHTAVKQSPQTAFPTALDLMAYIEKHPPVPYVYTVHTVRRGVAYSQLLTTDPAQLNQEALVELVYGDIAGVERSETRFTVYAVVNEEGRMLARRGGCDVWTLPPWQRDQFAFANGGGVYSVNWYLNPVYRKQENTLRTHQGRVGGRVVKMTFGQDPEVYSGAPLNVIFLD
jgi:hypothetical protein